MMLRRLLCSLWLTTAACAHGTGGPASPSAEASAGPSYDAELTTYPYPYEVRFHTVEAQGQKLRMAYMDVAPARPNGTTVVLLHGKNFSGAYWEDTLRALSERGFRVVVPDQIGFGKSSKPERFQFTFQALATHTRDLLDALRVERAAVVGHSMGGMLATRLVLMFPERFSGLVLVNPIGLEDWKRVVPYRTIDDWYQSELKSTPESVREYMRVSYFDGQWKPEYDKLVRMQIGWLLGPDRERVAWNAALTYDMVFTQPVLYEFSDVRVPTLLIIGQRDRTALGRPWAPASVRESLGDYPALGRKAAAAIPGARLVELPGIGHVPQVEDFEHYLGALLQFLPTRPQQ
ncbi:alpha/beta hydrolase [Myxococcaceae bacterium GXIMD 01537]